VERLDEFPEALRDDTTYPWDAEESPIYWPFGPRAGTPLGDFSSNALVRMHREVELKNGAGHYFDPLLQEIERMLTERQGE